MEVIQSQDVVRILEAALLCAPQPMSVREMRQMFDDIVSTDAMHAALAQIQAQWQDKGVALCEVASGWRFQTRPDVQAHLDRLHPEKPPKYSRATLETLAIVAYKQPVTRGDIEDIRGVTVSANIVKQLEDRGWVEVIGHRDAPGRPALFATTRQFLDDLGLVSLAQLPPLEGLPVGQALLPGLEPEQDDEPDASPALTMSPELTVLTDSTEPPEVLHDAPPEAPPEPMSEALPEADKPSADPDPASPSP